MMVPQLLENRRIVVVCRGLGFGFHRFFEELLDDLLILLSELLKMPKAALVRRQRVGVEPSTVYDIVRYGI